MDRKSAEDKVASKFGEVIHNSEKDSKFENPFAQKARSAWTNFKKPSFIGKSIEITKTFADFSGLSKFGKWYSGIGKVNLEDGATDEDKKKAEAAAMRARVLKTAVTAGVVSLVFPGGILTRVTSSLVGMFGGKIAGEKMAEHYDNKVSKINAILEAGPEFATKLELEKEKLEIEDRKSKYILGVTLVTTIATSIASRGVLGSIEAFQEIDKTFTKSVTNSLGEAAENLGEGVLSATKSVTDSLKDATENLGVGISSALLVKKTETSDMPNEFGEEDKIVIESGGNLTKSIKSFITSENGLEVKGLSPAQLSNLTQNIIDRIENDPSFDINKVDNIQAGQEISKAKIVDLINEDIEITQGPSADKYDNLIDRALGLTSSEVSNIDTVTVEIKDGDLSKMDYNEMGATNREILDGSHVFQESTKPEHVLNDAEVKDIQALQVIDWDDNHRWVERGYFDDTPFRHNLNNGFIDFYEMDITQFPKNAFGEFTNIFSHDGGDKSIIFTDIKNDRYTVLRQTAEGVTTIGQYDLNDDAKPIAETSEIKSADDFSYWISRFANK